MDFKKSTAIELDNHISQNNIGHTEARDKAIVLNENLTSREVDGLLSLLKRNKRDRKGKGRNQ